MNCSNQLSGNDQRVVCKRAYQKNYYAKSRQRILAQQKRYCQRTSGFSKPVVKDGMKTTRNDSPAAREPIVNRRRSTSEITEDNTVKTTGNGSTSIGEVIMPRIRNGSGKDFMTTSKEN